MGFLNVFFTHLLNIDWTQSSWKEQNEAPPYGLRDEMLMALIDQRIDLSAGWLN